jgi:DNA-binding NarL/FixJ family response regulator
VNVLIVEDNGHMRRMLREMIHAEFNEYEVHDAADGYTALAICHDVRPELILMDIGLPDANGLEITTEIKEVLPDSMVVIVTSNRGGPIEDAARKAGADAYVLKDHAYEKLIPTMKSLAAIARAESRSRGDDPQLPITYSDTAVL